MREGGVSQRRYVSCGVGYGRADYLEVRLQPTPARIADERRTGRRSRKRLVHQQQHQTRRGQTSTKQAGAMDSATPGSVLVLLICTSAVANRDSSAIT